MSRIACRENVEWDVIVSDGIFAQRLFCKFFFTPVLIRTAAATNRSYWLNWRRSPATSQSRKTEEMSGYKHEQPRIFFRRLIDNTSQSKRNSGIDGFKIPCLRVKQVMLRSTDHMNMILFFRVAMTIADRWKVIVIGQTNIILCATKHTISVSARSLTFSKGRVDLLQSSVIRWLFPMR